MDSGDDRYSTDGVGSYWTLIPGPASALIDTRLPTGELILGIRVFPGPFGNAAAAAPVGNEETLRTGFAGRPSSRHLLEAEMKRRAKVGDLKSSLREEARELADW